MSTAPQPLSPDSPSVIAHISTAQGVISRMAANSASMKTWCVTVVGAMLVFARQDGAAWACGLPIVMFAVLDAYYLGLERWFRRGYDSFVSELHGGVLAPIRLFQVVPAGRPSSRETLKAFVSVSVWPFYGMLAIGAAIVGNLPTQ